MVIPVNKITMLPMRFSIAFIGTIAICCHNDRPRSTVWINITINVNLNEVLHRNHVTGISGRSRIWSRGRLLHRSQSFHNLMPGGEGEPEPLLRPSSATSRSQITSEDSAVPRADQTEMGATYFQCRAARQSSHKDLLISVSHDDSFGRNVSVSYAAIGSFEGHAPWVFVMSGLS
jgi:hypothetical protein